MKPADRLKFFKDYTDERSKELKLKGVYVFISKNPATLYVQVSETAELPKDFASKLRAMLIASFNDQKFDEGLMKAIDMTLEAKGLEFRKKD